MAGSGSARQASGQRARLMASGSLPGSPLPSPAGAAPVSNDQISVTVRDGLPQLHADLDAWLRIPSISADPEHADDVRASAAWLVGALRRTGFPTVEVWETPGHPSVFAEWPSEDASAPTVVLYGHHDVQPVDP